MKRRSATLVAAPWLFTVGFFLLWEIACRAFKVSSFVLPPPSLIFAAMGQFAGPLTYHSLHTLWMTLAGFGLAILFGPPARHRARRVSRSSAS